MTHKFENLTHRFDVTAHFFFQNFDFLTCVKFFIFFKACTDTFFLCAGACIIKKSYYVRRVQTKARASTQIAPSVPIASQANPAHPRKLGRGGLSKLVLKARARARTAAAAINDLIFI